MQDIIAENMFDSIWKYHKSHGFDAIDLTAEDTHAIENSRQIEKINLKLFSDKALLWKALQLKCPVIIGDKILREKARKINIKAYNSIWVVSQLLRDLKINLKESISILEHFRSHLHMVSVDETEINWEIENI